MGDNCVNLCVGVTGKKRFPEWGDGWGNILGGRVVGANTIEVINGG